MAEKCAACGRADLMSPLVDNYQCLACGALTSMATGQVIPDDIPNPVTSPSGHPVTELSQNVTEAPADEYVTPVHVEPEVEPEAVVETPPEPEVEPGVEPEPEVEVTPDFDITSLTEEQKQALRDALD